ncbi:MAG: response regulator [Asticcacaulis sp.]
MTDATALIVEDSQTQGLIICKMIEAQGWNAHHCKSLREAQESLTQISVQAIFLDVFVGVYNSLQHMARFRELAPNIPIIVMTAGNNKDSIEETLQAARRGKADYVLKKPFSDKQLRSIFVTAYGNLDERTRRKHILVVDDSKAIRSVVTTMYEAAGYRVSHAESMESAFENVDVAHVDLVLCDVFMPGMGGLKGMRTIRNVWPHVKIIAMSAGLDDRVKGEEALNATRKIGADAQIKKPFSAEALIEVTSLLLNPEYEAA